MSHMYTSIMYALHIKTMALSNFEKRKMKKLYLNTEYPELIIIASMGYVKAS